MRVVSIIGPDREYVQQNAMQIREKLHTTGASWKVLTGAGPESHPDAVVAVLNVASAKDLDVASAVATAIGSVIILSSSNLDTQDIPGVRIARTIPEVCELLQRAGTDMARWISDAHRADAERLDRIRIAIRLEAHRIAGELTEQGIRKEEWRHIHSLFCALLRVEVLRQGASFPSVKLAPPIPPHNSDLPKQKLTVKKISLLITTVVTMAIAVAGAGYGLGRIIGTPIVGFIVGSVVGIVLGAIKLAELHKEKEHHAHMQRAQVLKSHWSSLVTDVSSRIHIPRIGEMISRD